MQTRLTDDARHRAPRDARRHGRRLATTALVAAVSEAGGFGCLGAVDDVERRDGRRDPRARKALTDKPFGVDLLTALPDRHDDATSSAHRRGRVGVRRRARRAARRHRAAATSDNVLVRRHVRQGAPRDRRGRGRAATSSSRRAPRRAATPGPVATMPLVPQIVDAVGDRVPVVAAGGIFDGRGLAAALVLGADGVWVGTRFIATPEARSAPGYKDALLRTARGRHRHQPRRSPARRCARSRNETTQHYRGAPRGAAAVPRAAHGSMRGRMRCTSARDERTPGVDPDRECYPAGQGVGAIDELVPGGRPRARDSSTKPRTRSTGSVAPRDAGVRAVERRPASSWACSDLRSCSYIVARAPRSRPCGFQPSFVVRLRRVADEQVDLGRALEARVLRDVRLPVVVAGACGTRRRGTRGWCASRRSRSRSRRARPAGASATSPRRSRRRSPSRGRSRGCRA